MHLFVKGLCGVQRNLSVFHALIAHFLSFGIIIWGEEKNHLEILWKSFKAQKRKHDRLRDEAG